MAGVDLLHVPYRGSFLPDLLGGQVQVVFGRISQFVELLRTGKLRALAVTTATRQPILPDIPTVSEFVSGYEASAWYGIGAPKNTPTEIIDKLNKETNAALADSKMTARLAVHEAAQDEFVLLPLLRTCGGSHHRLRDRRLIGL